MINVALEVCTRDVHGLLSTRCLWTLRVTLKCLCNVHGLFWSDPYIDIYGG